MSRHLRIEYPGALYHVMNRGDRGEPIFRDDQDRRRFLDTLAEACAEMNWRVHAFCLMPNHFHLVVETTQPNLVAGMKWLLGTYTGRFNRRHKLFGHLFSGPYTALLVDTATPDYLRTVSEYVHLNPVRAKLIPPDRSLRSFAWSSFVFYLQPRSRCPPWLRVDWILGAYGIPKSSATGRRQLELRLEERRRQENVPAQWEPVRHGWCLGDAAFRRGLLARVEGRWGAHHYGEERLESAVQKAERLVRAGLARARWREEDLAQRRRSDPVKLRVAAQLRRETTMTLRWIAQRLHMGSWRSLNRRLYGQRQGTEK